MFSLSWRNWSSCNKNLFCLGPCAWCCMLFFLFSSRNGETIRQYSQNDSSPYPALQKKKHGSLPLVTVKAVTCVWGSMQYSEVKHRAWSCQVYCKRTRYGEFELVTIYHLTWSVLYRTRYYWILCAHHVFVLILMLRVLYGFVLGTEELRYHRQSAVDTPPVFVGIKCQACFWSLE